MSTVSHPDAGGGRAFLDGGGEAARLIRERDWSDHPLGAPEAWPDALKGSLSLILNSPESMILAWGPDLHFFFNDTYIPLLGPRLSWAMGARFDRVWADAWAQAKPIIDDAFAGRSTHYDDLPWRLATDRGVADTWWSFSYSRVLGADGLVAGLFVFTNETTQRVLANRALTASQDELADALDSVRAFNEAMERRVAERTAERDRLWAISPDLLLVTDFDGRVLGVNPAWNDILGYDPIDLTGRSIFDLIHPDDIEATRHARAATRQGPQPAFENRYRHRDGSYRWIAWVGAPSDDEILAIGRHITEQKEAEEALRIAEEQLRQSQKVEAVGQLTGGVAHDFNNLLTVIRGSVDLLRRPSVSEDRRTRYLDAVADAAERATRLTAQLLAFARRQTLKPEVIDAGESLLALGEMIRTLLGTRVRVWIERAPAALFVNVDQSQFDTAVINMAVNARDAMNGAGELTIRIDVADGMPAIRTHPAVSGDFVAVTLTDTGSGIPMAELDRIFEPFFTTKSVGEGTGLGLSQVFGFAKQSGGEIVVQSCPGAGATFTLYLPRVSGGEVAARIAGGDDAIASVGEGACVLVVEDNPEVGTFAVQALAELGYATLLTTSGASALAELETSREPIDIVFSDVVMPGMSGIELAREVRRRHPALPVLLASGYSTVLAEEGTHGFDLLQKPYSIEDLARALRRVAAGAAR